MGCISSLIHSLCHFNLTSPSHHQPSQLTYLQTTSSSHPPHTVSPGTVENAFKGSSLFCITAGLNGRKGSGRISLCFLRLYLPRVLVLSEFVFSPVKYSGGEAVVAVAFFTLASSPQHCRRRQSQTFLHALYLHLALHLSAAYICLHFELKLSINRSILLMNTTACSDSPQNTNLKYVVYIVCSMCLT